MTTTDPRPTSTSAASMTLPSAGPDTRVANDYATPNGDPLPGTGALNGQSQIGAHIVIAVEGQTSPQATVVSTPNGRAPAGSATTPPAIGTSPPISVTLEGRKTSQDQPERGTHDRTVLAASIPGRQANRDAQWAGAAGEQAPVSAIQPTTPSVQPPVRDQSPPAQATPSPAPTIGTPRLADPPPPPPPPPGPPGDPQPDPQNPRDPLLALAADILDDLEKVRIGNENRLRQLTRDQADTDGIERGFGLDATHPDVARLAALVQLLADAEHQATLNLQRSVRKHALGAWVKGTKGIGEKQGARLIAAIGDPYWNDLHDRPRTVSELWAYCGYHVIRTPVSGQSALDAQSTTAADGPDIPASQGCDDAQSTVADGEQNGSGPGHGADDTQRGDAGVAPKRQRGQRANWSATAKMRAYLAAESCMKQRSSPYRAVYDATRAKYADATHDAECARCGPKNNPAKPGSALSDGHKHARALRAVAKEILRDLWREARETHNRRTA